MAGRKISFDGWTVDRDSGDLSRDGVRQRLQEMPLKVLDLLIETPGAVVSREQLISHLWPSGVVEFDTGLNTAVRKLRVALGDVADTPRYIETLPRKGYRFLGTLDPPAGEDPPAAGEVPAAEAAPAAIPTPQAETATSDGARPPASAAGSEPPTAVRRPRLLIMGAVLGALGISVLLSAGWLHKKVAATGSQSPSGVTIAVLPFDDLSAPGNDAYLSLGIAESVLHRLGELKELTVIARTSSFAIQDRKEDVRQIGQRLNARYLVEGSVQRSGDRLRVRAQLIDAVSGTSRWSLNFDRQMADIFALEDEISGKIVEQLATSVTNGGKAVLQPEAAGRPASIDAYMAYMQGRALINTYKVADAQEAVRRFEQATRIDPGYAAAYAQQSRAITHLLNLQQTQGSAALIRAVELNDKALALDPQLGEAWVQRATLQFNQNTGLAAAEQDYRKGLSLAPNYGQGFAEFAEFLYQSGKVPEALKMIDRARQLDPLAPRTHYVKGLFLLDRDGVSDEVKGLMQQALSANPDYFPALARLGQMYLDSDVPKGIQLMERALRIDPLALWVRESLAVSYLHIDEGEAAEDVLDVEGGDGRSTQACVLLHRGDEAGAAQFAYSFTSAPHAEAYPSSEVCEAASIRNVALRTGRLERAIRVLEHQYSQHAGKLGDYDSVRSSVLWGLPYSEVLTASGEPSRGNQLARAILAELDSLVTHKPGDAQVLFWRARALAVLGDRPAAIQSYESAVRNGFTVRPWIIEHEPSFAKLRGDPRFEAAVAAQKRWVTQQQARLAELRKRHEVPERHSPT